MEIEQQLKEVIKIYRENLDLEAKIKDIEAQINQNNRLIIKHFFPYLLGIYEKWRPQINEKAMAIYFEADICFEVTIKNIDGYNIRAQEGKKDVYHRFELNPKLAEYEVASFIIPKHNYDEIKEFFKFTFL